MSVIVMDDCLFYLNEAERYLSLYCEIDPFEEIFEAYKPETQLKVEQNAKAKTGVMGSLTKACQAIMKIIQNIIDSITDFFAKRNMDDEKRKAYESFKAACAKDPTLKNKKITVKDFNQLNQEYSAILSEAEKADRELAKGKELNIEGLLSKITSFTGNIGKGAMIAVGAEAALNMASSSQEIAQKMYSSLKNDKKLEQELIDAIGKKETKRFERDMKSLTKRVSLHRGIMKLKGTYSKSVEEAIDHTFDSVWDLVGHAVKIADTTKDLDKDIEVTGNALQRAGNKVSYIRKNFGTLAKSGAAIAKNSDIARRALGNETIRNTAINAMKTNSDSTKMARQKYQNELSVQKARQKEANRKKGVHEQSMWDSMVGKNDPNSDSNKVYRKFKRIVK